MRSFICVAVALWGAGCGVSQEPVATSRAEIGVTLAGPPAGIDCISLTLRGEDGSVSTTPFALTGSTTFRIRDVAIGAYDITAVAFSSGLPAPIGDGDCAAVPPNPPWATEAAVPVVVASGQATMVGITLVETGRVLVTASFVELPDVIASGQGTVGSIAAAGSFVAWVVKRRDGAGGLVMGLHDGMASPPAAIAQNQTNPAQLLIDPVTDVVYWENLPSGARDAAGNVIDDGS